MGEVGEAEYFRSEIALLNFSDASLKPPLSPLFILIDPLTPTDSSSPSEESHPSQNQEQHPKDAWLPITESRNGNAFSAAFHVLNSNIGFQALMLPVAFATLGWVWGTVCLTVAFFWQLYSIFLLIQLHESVPGIRHSRYLFLAMAAFGKRLGKVAALFPVMYLSGGTCVMLIITGGGTLKLLFKTLCDNDNGNTCSAHALTGAEWFLVFTCAAILVAQLPNLNSMAMVSLVGAVTAISYCTLFWVLSVKKGRPNNVSYTSTLSQESTAVAKISDVLNAVGIIVLAYRGHNVLLEIQANFERTSKKPMRRGVSMSYVLISMCVFPLAIAGFWAYGNQINEGGLLYSFPQFHRKQLTKFSMGAIYVLVIIHCLSSYQIYAMPVFDNLEIRFTSIRNEKCSRLARTCIRLFFGGLTFFIAVTFPFLPSLSALIGSITLVPITYSYPCFMFLSLKKPRPRGFVWWFNAALGFLGLLLSVLLLAAAARTLADKGLNANFFRP
ncbi:solute carrier family 32 [Vigna unguiculata]|uniref:Solute carrier family 32 n=1 Tax=Vigna unguiculata TaxID=3917 RepID=A0A4D6LJC3_VIGUN|nr:solute carrier family 32 [Vigna unguiculata]